MTNLLLGALLAGAVFFLWSALSWMVLPWQRGVFKAFADEDALAETIARQAPTSGIYGLPAEPKYPRGAGKEERERIDKAAWERLQHGPSVLAVITRESFGSFPRMLAIALLSDVVVALLLGWLLGRTTGLSYAERVLFLTLVALAAGLACRVPDWNWHKFPANHTLVNIASLTVGWSLAGLVLAYFVRGVELPVS